MDFMFSNRAAIRGFSPSQLRGSRWEAGASGALIHNRSAGRGRWVFHRAPPQPTRRQCSYGTDTSEHHHTKSINLKEIWPAQHRVITAIQQNGGMGGDASASTSLGIPQGRSPPGGTSNTAGLGCPLGYRRRPWAPRKHLLRHAGCCALYPDGSYAGADVRLWNSRDTVRGPHYWYTPHPSSTADAGQL